MKKDITILEITELSNNEKPDRHIRNIICHKCKKYGQTKKKQCDRHNKNVKCISKLEFEKDIMKENKERYNNSLEKVVNKVEKDDSSKKSNS